MGGFGSGRRYQYGRDTTTDCRWIDVQRWAREGNLRPGYSFSWQWTCDGEKVASINVASATNSIVLSYRQRSGGADWQDQRYAVRLEHTACHFGGSRVWFVCPARACGRRVAKLYLNGGIFACRHCYQLAYATQRESTGDRAVRKADKIRQRLGWEAGFLNGDGGKPKGMHWRTFATLKRRHDALIGVSIDEMDRRLEAIDKRFNRLR